MDVEGAEWMFFNSAASWNHLKDVEQFMFEIHSIRGQEWRMEVKRIALIILNLERFGFSLFHTRVNPNGFDLRGYDHTKVFNDKLGILLELSFLRCSSKRSRG